MGKISVLDESLANQIAAGEVVERPASVVKELIENSIDAKSTKIDIQIMDAGLTQILIKDNGEGIDFDDIERAFLRHATSKIKTTKDLFRISSLGFRGEALPSIAAVSKVTLKTSTSTNGYGLEVKVEGGNIVNREEIAYTKGTEISVEGLFYNTPARLKYMKSIQTELGHIIDYVNRLSLAYPKIAFTLTHNNRLILRTNGDGQLLHVISAIYGTSVAKSSLPLKNESLDYQIDGYISKPEITRANKSHISIFVNGRYIKNYLINQAIVKGYKTLLMVNRFPIAIIHITMDPSLIDINVHPAKLEARFSKEQELIKFIEMTTNQILTEQSFIRKIDGKAKIKKEISESEQSSFDLTIDSNLQYHSKKEDQKVDNRNSFAIKEERNEPIKKEDKEAIKTERHKIVFEDVFEESIQQDKRNSNTEKIPLLDPIGQLKGTYIIAQSENGLYLIDQHAAHERIQYEKNLALLNDEKVTSQELLLPLTIDLPKSEAEQVIDKLDYFTNIGITMEEFGNQTFIVRSIPYWMPSGQEKIFVEKMIEMVITENKVNLEELRKDLIASTSCKSAIKANKFLTKNELEVLLEQLRNTDNPFSCPHGRPTIIHFSYYEIEKMFKRVV